MSIRLLMQKSHTKKNPKKRIGISYRAITNHFRSHNPYKKDDAQPKAFMEDLLLFVSKATCLFLLWKING